VSDDDRARHLINVAAEAAQAGSLREARGLIQRALATKPSVELRIRAWRTLADVTDDRSEKRECLENIRLADPTDGLAQRDLALLDGRLDPRDIVDPDRGVDDGATPPVPAGNVPTAIHDEQPFKATTCSACGAGQLVYSPEFEALVCSHCGSRQPLERPTRSERQTAPPADFAVAMWTAKARRVPTTRPLVTCEHCGAGFVVKAGVMSTRCFYCGSTATLRPSDARELLSPDAILPLTVTREHAAQVLESVLGLTESGAQGQTLSAGYVPVWLFAFGGHVRWTGVARQQLGDLDRHPKPVTGTYTLSELVVPIFGTTRLHGRADLGPPEADFTQAVPFNEEYLAGYTTESYDITLEQAAVAARPAAIDRTRDQVVESTIDEAVGVEISTAGLGVETFKLLLVPIWIASASGDRLPVILNGRTGEPYSRSGGGVLGRLRRTLGIE
jgi:hypothetical protein